MNQVSISNLKIQSISVFIEKAEFCVTQEICWASTALEELSDAFWVLGCFFQLIIVQGCIHDIEKGFPLISKKVVTQSW